MAATKEEILDLVNDQDEVIGTIDRAKYDNMVEQNLGYIRSVELLIRNSSGQYWIPTRTPDKTIAPNGLDYSMGGHVDAGEGYIEAALREIREELNLHLKSEDIVFVTKFKPALIHYFRTVYLYETDQTPQYNPTDFVKAEWLSLEEIERRLKSGVPSKRNLLMTTQKVEKFISL